MNKTTIIFFAFFLMFAVTAGIDAQIKNTENTLKLGEGGVSQKASIADMAWLAGGWTGTGLGGVSEEMWSQPIGGIMIGTYRLIKDGKPVFYEMLMLIEKDETLVFRLKHFDPNFIGWEEKDKTVDFMFVSKDKNRLYFSGLTFERVGEKEMKIYLALRQRDGSLREELFSMKRNDK